MASQGTSPAKRFGALLRHHRLALDLSQAKLASRAGVSKSQVALLELDKRRASRDAVLALTKALSLGPQDRDEFLMRAGHAPVGRNASASLPGLERAIDALSRDSRLSPEERLYIETLASSFIDWIAGAVREGQVILPGGGRKK